MRRKLGLFLRQDEDIKLADDLLKRMAENQADFTLTFRGLAQAAANPKRDSDVSALFTNPAAFDEWAARWRDRLSLEDVAADARREKMLAINPMYIPRNHRIEAAIAGAEAGNFGKIHDLVEVLARPYDKRPEFADYAKPPAPEEEVLQTFCGT